MRREIRLGLKFSGVLKHASSSKDFDVVKDSTTLKTSVTI
jgi:hypothetical protein